MRVHLLTEYRSPNSLALNYPFLVHRPFFNKEGIKFYFYENLSDKIYGCDVIFINSKFFKSWHAKREEALFGVLASFKKKIQKVIWFDTNDSTGTTQFNVMPFVDGYYKNQVLKDASLYTKPFYGHRIFTDYYNRTFKVFDEESAKAPTQSHSVSVLLQPQYAHKLHVSWNSAMNEWGRSSHFFGHNYFYEELVARIRTHLPFKTDYTVQFIKVEKNRKIDVNGRIGLSHSRNTIRYQRQMIANILREKFNVDTNKVSRRRYLVELSNSKIGISPFGWGEINYRDFEIIINGALLIKSDMSHLETWPPLYVENETYISYSWGLEDFEEKLRDILRNKEKIIAISKKAQELYAYYLYGNGRFEFCNKVLNIIHR